MSKELSAFLWRDRHGTFYRPYEMETRHVFFTIRLIWNHSAPEHLKIEPYTRYYFDEFYTPDYMGQAVRSLMIELSKREDMEAGWKRDIEYMKDVLLGTSLQNLINKRYKELQGSTRKEVITNKMEI